MRDQESLTIQHGIHTNGIHTRTAVFEHYFTRTLYREEVEGEFLTYRDDEINISRRRYRKLMLATTKRCRK